MPGKRRDEREARSDRATKEHITGAAGALGNYRTAGSSRKQSAFAQTNRFREATSCGGGRR